MAASGTAPSPAGFSTHHEFFASLGAAGVAYLVTGGVALVLHGVPRLTPDIDLAVGPGRGNVERLERLLGSWGYGETGGGTGVRRFGNQRSALGEIDVVVPPESEFADLLAGAETAALVDLAIPFVGAADLVALKERGATDADRDDAAALGVLAEVRAGATGDGTDARREQIRKFSRWSVAARLDWLLASARLAKGMAPEVKPRGLPRRRGWYGDGRR